MMNLAKVSQTPVERSTSGCPGYQHGSIGSHCGAVKGRNRIVSGCNLEMGAYALSITEKKDLSRLSTSELRAREILWEGNPAGPTLVVQ